MKKKKKRKDLQIQTGNYDRTRDRKDLLRGFATMSA